MARPSEASSLFSTNYWKQLAGNFQPDSVNTWTDIETYLMSDSFWKAFAIGIGVAVVGGVIAARYLFTPLPDGLYPEDRWPLRRIVARNQFKTLLVK